MDENGGRCSPRIERDPMGSLIKRALLEVNQCFPRSEKELHSYFIFDMGYVLSSFIEMHEIPWNSMKFEVFPGALQKWPKPLINRWLKGWCTSDAADTKEVPKVTEEWSTGLAGDLFGFSRPRWIQRDRRRGPYSILQ